MSSSATLIALALVYLPLFAVICPPAAWLLFNAQTWIGRAIAAPD
jgi:hypothetical protein